MMKWLNLQEDPTFWQVWQACLIAGVDTDGAWAGLKDALARSFPPDHAWLNANVDPEAEFEQRWQLLRVALPALTQFFADRNFPDTWIEPLWGVWLPVVRQLQRWRKAQGDRPLIVGFLGGQGSGKTTLTALLALLLSQGQSQEDLSQDDLSGHRVMSWSLDDLYLPYADRLVLQQQDPRLVRRGPPGTHDVALGLQILRDFQLGLPEVQVPRFDKSLQGGAGDRTGFDSYGAMDFVLFEGWFVGARPIAPFMFADAPMPIMTDMDRAFAQDMNQSLYEYLPLWEMLDRLIILNLQDYRWSKQWRKQAEHLMADQGKPGMSDAEIDEFVDYFWKALHPELFITPLTQAGGWADLVLEIGADHWPDRVYQPI